MTNVNKNTAAINKVDDNGIVYSYKYDKLGNITEVKKGNSVVNKYYYDEHSELIKDEETGLYYLKTRYYSAKLKRFINADALITGNGFNSNNLYCYCNNEPISQSDLDGYFLKKMLVEGLVGGAISAGTKIVSNVILRKPIFEDVGKSFVTGFISGAINSLKDNFFLNLGVSIILEMYDVFTGNSTITEAVFNVGVDALFSAFTINGIDDMADEFKIPRLSDEQKDSFSKVTQIFGEYTKNITSETVKKSENKKNKTNKNYYSNNKIKYMLQPKKPQKTKTNPKSAKEFIEMSDNKKTPSEEWTNIINSIKMGYCKI